MVVSTIEEAREQARQALRIRAEAAMIGISFWARKAIEPAARADAEEARAVLESVVALLDATEPPMREKEDVWEETNKRLLDLHGPVEIEPSETICGQCSFQLPNGAYFGKVEEWPCPTVRVLQSGAEARR